MPENEVRTNITLDVNRAAAKRVQDETARIRQLLEAVKKQVAALDRALNASDSGFTKLETRSKAGRIALDKLDTQAEQVKRQVKALDDTFKSARGADQYADRVRQAAQQTELFGDVGSRTRDIGGGIAALGGRAVEQKLFIASDLLDAAEGFGRIKAELPALISQLALTPTSIALLAGSAVALGAAAVIAKGEIDKITDSFNALKAATQARVAGAEAFFGAVGEATTEDAKTRRDELRQQIDQDRALLASLEADRARAMAVIEQEGGIAGPLFEAAVDVGLVKPLGELDEGISRTETRIGASVDELLRWNEAVRDGTLSINDDRVERDKDTENRIALLDKEAQTQIQYATANRETVDARLRAIEVEREAREQFIENLGALGGDQAADEIEKVQQQLELLTVEERTLVLQLYQGAVAISAAEKAEKDLEEARKEAEKRIKDLTAAEERRGAAAATLGDRTRGQVETLLERQQDQREAIFKRGVELERDYNAGLAETLQDRRIATAREAEDFARERLRDLADHYSDLAQMDADYARDRQSILDDLGQAEDEARQDILDEIADYNKDARRAAEDHQDALRDIQRRGDEDIQSAALKLDAQAIYDAQKQRARDLRDENEQYEKEKRRRDEDFRDRLRELEREKDARTRDATQRLRELDEQHQRERQANERAFQVELQREDENRRIKLQRQQADWAREDALAEAHYQAQQAALQQAYIDLEEDTREGLADVREAFREAIEDIRQEAEKAGATTTGTGGWRQVPQFQHGGYTGRGGSPFMAELHPDEYVIPGGIARMLAPSLVGAGRGGGSNSLSQSSLVNVQAPSGADAGQIGMIVRREVERVFRDLGR